MGGGQLRIHTHTQRKMCNTSALHIGTLDYYWLEATSKFSKPMILRKMMTKSLCGNFEKVFSYEENGFKKDL